MKKSFGLSLATLPLLALLISGCGGDPATSSAQTSANPNTSGGQDTSHSGETSASTDSAGSSATSGDSSESDVQPVTYTGKLRIWYHNDAMSFDNLVLYLWNTSVDGQQYEFTQLDPTFGMYYEIDLGTSTQFKDSPSVDIRFIIKYRDTWAGQTLDTVAPFSTFKSYDTTSEDGTEWMNIYAAAGENSTVEVFPVKTDALGDHLDAVSMGSDWKSIKVTGTGTPGSRSASEVGKVASYELYGYTRDYYLLSADEKTAKKGQFKIKNGAPASNNFTIDLDGVIDPTTSYVVEALFSLDTTRVKRKSVSLLSLYDTSKFTSSYVYSGADLGVTLNSDGSRTFKLWAPTSSRVQLCLYMGGTPSYLKAEPNGSENWNKKLEMSYGSQGVWSYTIPSSDASSLLRKFYTYIVTNSAGVSEVADPYAKSTGINGLRSAILDFSSTDPSDWSDGAAVDNALPKISSPSALTIYEAHIRDLTADASWTGNARHGTYQAFYESGTSYSAGSTSVKTGFDNIKELGVNAVQLLPVFDQDNDERWITSTLNGVTTTTAPSYNWGYNPLNYSVVEGGYSSDPFSASTKVTEYKNLIETYAKAGIRIIMDVVYNHVSSAANSNFTKIVPQYYLRTTASGAYYDGSGVGNVTASERPMMRKLIVDSVCWWASEYRIKGFRFDLMGCLDTDTMRAVKDALYAIDPSIVVYGEGWAGSGDGSTGLSSGYTEAKTNGTYAKLAENGKGSVGCFNDGGRDGTKGNTQWANVTPSYGFVSQGSGDLSKDTKYRAGNMWRGQNGNAYDYLSPDQTINYVSCHDNYTLYDQLNYCLGNGLASDTDSLDAAAATVACTASVLFSQGVAFVQGGEEILRTKVMAKDDPYYDKMVASYGSHTSGTSSWIAGDGVELKSGKWLVRNSYMYGDAVNSFKWDRKVTYKQFFDKMAQAVALRNSKMGDLFGYSASKVVGGAVSLWGASDMDTSNTVIAANVASAKTSSAYYLIFGGRNTDTYSSIGIGNGGVEIVYSSSVPAHPIHSDGQTFTISNNLFGAGKYEFCLVKRVSNA